MSAWVVVAIVRAPTRCTETIRVDGACYLEALSLLGDAWELRAFIRYRTVASYVANVEPAPLDLRVWVAGREVWNRNEATNSVGRPLR